MIKPEITKQCSFCGDNFTASKPTSKFCCNSCRTKAYVKRKQDEQINAAKEAQKLKEKELQEQLANARRIRQEQRAEAKRLEKEKQTEIDQLAKEAQRIKEEQIAAELEEQKRKEAEERQKILDKLAAEEAKRLADKEAKRILKQKRKALEFQVSYQRGHALGLILGNLFGHLDEVINSRNNQPGTTAPTKAIPQHMNGITFAGLNSGKTGKAIKPNKMPRLGYMTLPGLDWK